MNDHIFLSITRSFDIVGIKKRLKRLHSNYLIDLGIQGISLVSEPKAK